MTELIIKHYLNGAHMTEVASLLNIDYNKVKRTLVKNDIKLRTRTETNHLNRNYDSFLLVDTEEKAYWLGFIMTDGCVFKNKLVLSLKGGDSSHLEKFKSFLNSPTKISVYDVILNKKSFSVCSFTAISEVLVNSLVQYGITPNKSNTLVPVINSIDKRFLNSFWRGVIDGDGSILYKKYPKISLVGTFAMCKLFLENYGLDYKITKKKNNQAYQVGIQNKKVIDILKDLYENATIYLERKKEIYDKVEKRDKLL